MCQMLLKFNQHFGNLCNLFLKSLNGVALTKKMRRMSETISKLSKCDHTEKNVLIYYCVSLFSSLLLLYLAVWWKCCLLNLMYFFTSLKNYALSVNRFWSEMAYLIKNFLLFKISQWRCGIITVIYCTTYVWHPARLHSSLMWLWYCVWLKKYL